MRFAQLCVAAGEAPPNRGADADVSDVVADSRRCRPGSCFVAVRGTAADGHRFIPAAAAAGACAVVCEDASTVPATVACAVVDDTRRAVGRLAQAIHGWPVRKLTCVGITGTNGKSTVAHLLNEVLAARGRCPALLGTIAYQTGSRSVPAATTTPDPVTLAELTAEMVAAGRTHLVMEVSSHALDQRRVAGLEFGVGIFTNLTGDHLDYHETMQRYQAAKQKLFEDLAAEATAVISAEDPAGQEMARSTRANVVWYGLSPAADLWASIRRIDSTGTEFTAIRGPRHVPVRTPLIGRHNVLNCLAALAALEAMGIDLSEAADALAKVGSARGRLERVAVEAPFQVFVDYAHTDDALRNVLSAVRPLTRGRVIVVFGCGGDRDRTKRPRMGRTAEELADVLVITSDNPRSEKPEAIIEEIRAGLTEAGRRRATIQPDRRSAIATAIRAARAGDIVLIAGKGHEDYQIIGPERIHFDDVEVAGEVMRKL